MRDLIVLADKESNSYPCNCCGEPIYNSMGLVLDAEGIVADYWIRWSAAHKGLFSCAIAISNPMDSESRVIYCLNARGSKEGISYSLLSKDECEWWNFEGVGWQLSRDEALESRDIDFIFELAELISTDDCRLALNLYESLEAKYPDWAESMYSVYVCAYEQGIDIPSNEPVLWSLSNLKHLPGRFLQGAENFIGVEDSAGIALQFYKNKDSTISLDIPIPSKSGSYQKTMDIFEVEKTLESFTGLIEKDIDLDKLEFVEW